MADTIQVFKRTEKKFSLSSAQRDAFLSATTSHFRPDAYGTHTICSLYLDTPNHLLIRNSIEATIYKEKLRLRSYGTPTDESKVFLELKKKYDGIVYKRRISMSYKQAMQYIDHSVLPDTSQIMHEIDYAMQYYQHPKGAMLICYDREGYDCVEDDNLRITIDNHIRYRDSDLDLTHGSYGKTVPTPQPYLLEIKTSGGMPLWLVHALQACHIQQVSFSKYGTAYKTELHN